jgi:NTE family protein
MNGTRKESHGIILSGGGANGAYEIGVLKALFAGKAPIPPGNLRLEPDVFAGTSVGSYNAAFLVSRWGTYGSAAIASLEQLWLDTVSSSTDKPANGVFRIREDPRPFIDPRSFIRNPIEPFFNLVNDSAALAWYGFERAANLVRAQEPLLDRLVQLIDFTAFVVLEPFRKLIQDTVWFSEIRSSQKKLQIAATNWELGTVRIFENQDMTDQLGPVAVLASTAIPGVFPPVAFGANQFVDGGVLLNTPLNPVIDAGANVVHVISLFPNVENITLGTMNSTMATVYRQQVIGWAKSLESNVRRVRDINQALRVCGYANEVLEQVRERFSATDLATLRIEDIERFLGRYQAYTPVTVHQYYPGDDMSGVLGLLDFDRDRLKVLIERGFEDAVHHNCIANNCVIAEEDTSAAEVAPTDGLFAV